MEYDFNILDAVFKSGFTAEQAQQRRNSIVKITQTGRRHWFPIEVNARNGNCVRRDVAWKYGASSASGAFYFTRGRIGYDANSDSWKQVPQDDELSFPINIPIHSIDKIKVVSVSLVMENASRVMSVTGAVGVQIRSGKSSSDVFLQEVSKYDTKATIARYKIKRRN